jgi:D-inositol-3-phosphate glycosyltransferase
MKKQSIAFISEHASPLAKAGGIDSGGQNIYVRELAIELSRKGFEIDIFTRKDCDTLPEVLDWMPGVRVIHVSAGPATFVQKEELLPFMEEFGDEMVAFIRREQLDYKLVHANFWMSGMVAMQLKAQLSIPFVITFHALGLVRSLHQQEADKFPKERTAIEREIIHYADKIIAECPQDAEDLDLLYDAPKKNMVIIPCGFNPEEFFPISKDEARRQLKLDPDEKILLQLGRIVPRKGIDNVIMALKHFPESIGPVKLLIVGGDQDKVNGPCATELERLKQLAIIEGLFDKVLFTGPKQHDELKYYYSAADVFISTPWYEPFGITPLESMACGTPVIGSNVGGIKYSVVDGQTGFLVPPKSPAALAKKIENLLRNPSLAKSMRVACVRRANDYFTWQKIAEQMKSTYNSLILTQRKYVMSVAGNEMYDNAPEDKARNFISAKAAFTKQSGSWPVAHAAK